MTPGKILLIIIFEKPYIDIIHVHTKKANWDVKKGGGLYFIKHQRNRWNSPFYMYIFSHTNVPSVLLWYTIEAFSTRTLSL